MERWGTPTLTDRAGLLVLGLVAASCTAILGIDKDYRELRGGAGGGGSTGSGGAGGSIFSSSSNSSSSSSSSGASGSGGAGGGVVVWHSWDVATSGNPPKLSVLDTNGQHEAAIIPYQSKGLMDLAMDAGLTSFTPGMHPNGYNNIQGFWTIPASSYPYVGKSAVPRGMDGGELSAPQPLGVYDLQLHPSSDTTKLVVAGFVIPLDGDYTISTLSARRVSGNGDLAALRIFVGNTPAGPMMLAAAKDRSWVNDGMTYSLGTLPTGTQINFAVDPLGDSNHDATEIAWTITAQ
jgi:hypothetical protein